MFPMEPLQTSGHPAGLWISGWRLIPPAHGAAPDRRIRLRTMNEPGSVGPAKQPAGWSFHLERSAEQAAPEVRLYSFGFQLNFPPGPDGSPPHGASSTIVFTPEPGVLCGHAGPQVKPALFCAEAEVHSAEQTSWLHAGQEYLMLLKESAGAGTRFCMVVSEPQDQAGAVSRACHYLGQDLPGLFEAERQRRAAFWAAVENLDGPDDLAARALETLFAHLRPPEGALPFRWSATALGETPRFDINQLLPLVLAWREVDPAVATDLVKCALACQGPDGFVPAHATPDELGTGAAVLPLLAQAAEQAWSAQSEPGFLDYVLPRLRAYLVWALRHYQPDGADLPGWTCAEEALIPETYDQDLASADLTTFLLVEIEAYLRLARTSFALAGDEAFWLEHVRRLASLLENTFWDGERECFPDRYRQGTAIERITLSAILPLLRPALRPACRQGLLRWLNKPDGFTSGQGVPDWIRWETDSESPPVRALHQVLVLVALQRANAQAELQAFCRELTEILHRLFVETGGLADPLAVPSPEQSFNVPQAAPPSAALAIFLRTIPARRKAGEKQAAPAWQWLDRRRRLLFILPTSLLVAGWLALALAFLLKTRPPKTAIETWFSLAQRRYREGHYADAQALYEEVLSRSPGIVPVELFLANAMLKQGNLAEAEAYYRRLIARTEENPVPFLNLAVTLYWQGRTNEAARGFQDFIEKFGEKHPDLAARAREALVLLSSQEAGRPASPSRP